MRADGFEPEVDWATTRRSLQGRIAEAIKDLWGDKVTREDLGIVAKARAVLYFNGERHLITSDSIKELAETRTSHLINIEKEGVTDVLLDLAKPHRIALVATAGQPVRYAKDLAKACKDNRIRVCPIYDDDLIGRESADAFKKLGLNVPRLGVDMNTVKWLQQNGYPDLKLTDVLEDYSPQNRQIWKYDEYLKNQKIEIDMIIAKVGAEALWKWILYKLTETFPEQINYIDIVDEPRPEEYFPKELQDLQDYLEDLCELSYSNRWEEIQHNDLEAVDPKDGLMNVEDKNEEIFNELDNVVKEDQHVKDVSKSIKGLLDSLPSIADLKKKYDAMKEDR